MSRFIFPPLPDLWRKARISDIATLTYGKALHSKRRAKQGEVGVYGSSGLVGRHDESLGDGPSIIIGRKGNIGAIHYVSEPFWCIDTAFYLTDIREVVDLEYLAFALEQIHLPRLAINVAVPGISRDDILRERISLPPVSEQRRIVEILKEVDAIRDLRRQADRKANDLPLAIFMDMFGDPATNPKGLPLKRLGDLISVKSGNFLPAKGMTEGGQCPVYGGNGINGYHSEFMFEDRKVVIGRVGAYCGAVHYSEPNSWITDNALYVDEMSNELEAEYLLEALRVADLNRYAGRAGQPLISAERLNPVKILVPDKDLLQKPFIARMRELSGYSQEAKRSSELGCDLSTVLSQRAFSGSLTDQWREQHLEMLLAECAQRDALLAESGALVVLPPEKKVFQSVQGRRNLVDALDDEQRAFLDILLSHKDDYFTPESLLDEHEALDAVSCRSHIELFAAAGFIQNVSLPGVSGKGDQAWLPAYRLARTEDSLDSGIVGSGNGGNA